MGELFGASVESGLAELLLVASAVLLFLLLELLTFQPLLIVVVDESLDVLGVDVITVKDIKGARIRDVQHNKLGSSCGLSKLARHTQLVHNIARLSGGEEEHASLTTTQLSSLEGFLGHGHHGVSH